MKKEFEEDGYRITVIADFVPDVQGGVCVQARTAVANPDDVMIWSDVQTLGHANPERTLTLDEGIEYCRHVARQAIAQDLNGG